LSGLFKAWLELAHCNADNKFVSTYQNKLGVLKNLENSRVNFYSTWKLLFKRHMKNMMGCQDYF
jgi:hypothetical protein